MNVSTTKANQKDLHLEGNWSILAKYSWQIRVILYKHEFFGRGVLEDLHYSQVANTEVKKGIFSYEILLKQSSPE